MLIRFTVENFKSFKERTEFNMLSGDYRRHKHHVTKIADVPLVRAAAVYGPNGSGKSNLVEALTIYKYMIEGSTQEMRSVRPFLLSTDTEKAPTIFIGEFAIDDSVWEFGFKVVNNVVAEEWLNKLDGITYTHETANIYKRFTHYNGAHFTTLNVNEHFYTDPVKDDLKYQLIAGDHNEPDKLIIQKLANSKLPGVKELITEMSKFVAMYKGVHSVSRQHGFFITLLAFKDTFEYVNQNIKAADMGICRLHISTATLKEFLGINEQEKTQEITTYFNQGGVIYDLSNDLITAVAVKQDNDEIVVKILYYIHKDNLGKERPFVTGKESDGTVTSLALLVIMSILRFGKELIVIDEIERSLHPLLLTAYLKKFMADPDVKGQLIFTTHETRLLDLDIFRQDEIWFTQKNQEGASTMYPLSDYDVRHDLDLENGYLNGRFGAVPYLSDLMDADITAKH